MRKSSLIAVGLLAAIATAALALYSSPTVVYSDATLDAGSAGVASERIDTARVSDATRQDKPDQFVVAIAGTTQATAADSMFRVVVKAIRNGQVMNIGEDSIVMQPDPPASAGQVAGEVRVLRWVADSLQLVTRNPKAATVTGAQLTVDAQRTK